jgi:hypothetical protein
MTVLLQEHPLTTDEITGALSLSPSTMAFELTRCGLGA